MVVGLLVIAMILQPLLELGANLLISRTYWQRPASMPAWSARLSLGAGAVTGLLETQLAELARVLALPIRV